MKLSQQKPIMSSADEKIQSGSEVSHEKDLMEDEESLQGSEASPIPPTDDTTNSGDSNSQDQLLSSAGMPVTNGSPTQPKIPASGVSTPPRCDSPRLRLLLTSPIRVKPSLIVSSELQHSTSTASEARIIPGAAEGSKTEGGNVHVKIPSTEVVGASVPGIMSATEAEGGNVPEAIPSSDATSSNASLSAPGAEVDGSNLPETVSAAETGGSVLETRTDAAAGSNVPETVSTSEVVADDNSRAEPAADAQVSGVPADAPATEAKEADISEVPNIDAVGSNVLKSIQSTVNVPASVTATESKGDGVAQIPATENSFYTLEDQIAKYDKVHEPAQSSENVSVSEGEPHAQDKADEAPEEPEGNVSKMVIDASVAKDPVPEIEKGEESGDPSSQPTEEAMETSEPAKSVTTVSGPFQISELDKRTEKTSEQKSAVSGLVEDAMETSDTEKSATTGEESGKTSELSKEAAQTSEPKSAVGEECSQISEPTEDAMESFEPEKSATTAEESVQTSELSKEVVQTSEPKSTAVEECSQASEPTEVAMETSEPATTGAGSGQTSKHEEVKQEETDKIISKESEKSPFKKPTAKGRLEDLKSDEPQTPKSPSRRSVRLQALQRTHSESPSPKKERKAVRSITLERVPSDDKIEARNRGRRVGSTSSNSEMEGSGDENKTKRVSRKDSKK